MADEPTHPLIEWATNQPKWQQHALRLIAKYGFADAIPEADLKQIKEILTKEAKGEEPMFTPISASDIPNTSASEKKTYLKSLGPISNIDKLASGQEPFSFVSPNGLTVIFGNNGSGKSGYARILKNLCWSQDAPQDLKGDATKAEAEAAWQVDLTYAEKVRDNPEGERELKWTKAKAEKRKKHGEQPDADYMPLKRIAFFDSRAASIYVDGDKKSKSRALFYNPPELRLYRVLTSLAETLKENIEAKAGELKRQRPQLPETTNGTAANVVISNLETEKVGQLTQKDVEAICVLSDEEQTELIDLRTKKTRTPEQQKLILQDANTTLSKLKKNYDKTVTELSSEVLVQLYDKHQAYQTAKWNADQGVAGLAKKMPISEDVGSDIWFEMFRAARTFASKIYPEAASPPIANSDYCVLCHQDLSDNARERLKQFDDFMNGELQKNADKAEQTYTSHLAVIESLPDLDHEAFKQQLMPFADLSDANKQHVDNIVLDMKTISSRLTSVKVIIRENGFDDLQSVIDEELKLKTDFDTLITEITSELARLDSAISSGASRLSAEEQSKLSGLADKEKCASQKTNINNYFNITKQIELLDACKEQLKTHSISSQSSKRGPELYSDALQTRYSNEIGRLGLQYLNISVTSQARKGEQKVVTNLAGLSGAKKSDILSEGEQRAVALAGFLTEVNEVNTGHAIIFDDPVSSLDWDRRGLIAERLAEESRKRQVVVFTHDFSFALQLEKIAKDKNKGNQAPFFQQLWIAKQSTGTGLQFGVTGDDVAAWESKKVKQRLQIIQNKIQQLEQSSLVADGSGTSEFETCASDIAKQLRQTWERAVEEVALNETIRRLYPNVMTTKLEYVQFDCSKDYATLHEGMATISVPAHDNPELSGNASPTLEQLKQSKSLLEGWVKGLQDKRKALKPEGKNTPSA